MHEDKTFSFFLYFIFPLFFFLLKYRINTWRKGECCYFYYVQFPLRLCVCIRCGVTIALRVSDLIEEKTQNTFSRPSSVQDELPSWYWHHIKAAQGTGWSVHNCSHLSFLSPPSSSLLHHGSSHLLQCGDLRGLQCVHLLWHGHFLLLSLSWLKGFFCFFIICFSHSSLTFTLS